MDDELRAVIPAVATAFDAWWTDRESTAGTLEPDDETACLVAFAAAIDSTHADDVVTVAVAGDAN